MKKNYVLAAALLATVGFLSFQRAEVSLENAGMRNHHLNAAGAPTGTTGAPGEATCTQCHSGQTQSGTGINNLMVLDGASVVTTYTPGATYNVTLSLNSGNVKEGFNATVLELATNVFAGNFPGTGGFGTAINSAGGRDYATHTSSSNNEGNLFWAWTWEAPATDVGPVRFYVASNVANGNDDSSGDVIYLSEHVYGSAGAGVEEIEELVEGFSAGYSHASHSVNIQFNAQTIDNLFFNLVDLNGKSVYTDDLGTSSLGKNTRSVALPSGLKSGIYMVNFFVGNKAMSSKILIQE
jgi:hypothetical protein